MKQETPENGGKISHSVAQKYYQVHKDFLSTREKAKGFAKIHH